MRNGRRHDNPITDVTVWNMEVFGPFEEVEGLTDLIFRAENDRSKTPELRKALADLLARLRAEAET